MAKRGLIAALAIMAGLPAVAQDSVIGAVKNGADQQYVLLRCSGFYKALLTLEGGPEAGTESAVTAMDRLDFLFTEAVVQHLETTGGDSDNPDDIAAALAVLVPAMDDHRDFYLGYIAQKSAAGEEPLDTMMQVDTQACNMVQGQRAPN